MLRLSNGDMEDILLALLGGLAEMFFDVLLQLIAEQMVALIVRSLKNVVEESRAIHPILAGFGYLILGVGCGSVSIFLFPHPFVHRSRIHGISVLISPVITGLIMAQAGLIRRRKDMNAVRIESFWYGYAFALGMAFVRFLVIE